MADEGGTSKEPGRPLNWRTALAVAGGLVVFGLVWWLVPLLLHRSGGTPDALLTAVTTTRAALLAGFVGLGALGTFWVNSRTLRITARTADVTARTLEVTEQGHITDRYTKAIGQLGDDKLDIRLGGIYALERLAVDSKRDHPTVVEVLSAFVRERTPAASTPHKRPAGRKTAHPPSLPSRRAAQMTTDVEASLTVLGRLPNRRSVSRGDLRSANLAGADLRSANLAGADLGGAKLTGADLRSANLAGADLGGAILAGANLGGANLAGANLRLANLAGLRLGKGTRHAYLAEANLAGADLEGANLAGASLAEAKLTGADLRLANLTGAELFKVDLTGAYLRAANLTGAYLVEANLTDADVRYVKLTGADVRLSNLADAKGDPTTVLPERTTRPKSWPSDWPT